MKSLIPILTGLVLMMGAMEAEQLINMLMLGALGLTIAAYGVWRIDK